MSLVRIDVPAGKTADYRSAIGDEVYTAMIGILNVPRDDRFQVIAEHESSNLVIDPVYLGVKRTRDAIVIQVTLNEGRTIEQKRGFYKTVADALHRRIGMRRDDVFISRVEVKKENRSFGNGEAQYAV